MTVPATFVPAFISMALLFVIVLLVASTYDVKLICAALVRVEPLDLLITSPLSPVNKVVVLEAVVVPASLIWLVNDADVAVFDPVTKNASLIAAVPNPILANCGLSVVPRSLVASVIHAGAAEFTPSPVCDRNTRLVDMLPGNNVMLLVPLPYGKLPSAQEVRPVPPLVTVSAAVRLRAANVGVIPLVVDVRFLLASVPTRVSGVSA